MVTSGSSRNQYDRIIANYTYIKRNDAYANRNDNRGQADKVLMYVICSAIRQFR